MCCSYYVGINSIGEMADGKGEGKGKTDRGKRAIEREMNRLAMVSIWNVCICVMGMRGTRICVCTFCLESL